MCEYCSDDGSPVNLTRRFPKNKVDKYTTPSEYLLGWAEARGLFRRVGQTRVREEFSNGGFGEVVGYYDEYAGAIQRMYSAPMFTFKPALSCHTHCAGDHLPGKDYASRGCICGDISRPSYNCPDHPVPSVDSRWVRLHQNPGSVRCRTCDIPLDQENWSDFTMYFCSANCRITRDRLDLCRERNWYGRQFKRG